MRLSILKAEGEQVLQLGALFVICWSLIKMHINNWSLRVSTENSKNIQKIICQLENDIVLEN